MIIKRTAFSIFFTVLFLSFLSCRSTCPITSCNVRMVHAHGEKEFKGQPFYKKQNPKMGEKVKVHKEQ